MDREKREVERLLTIHKGQAPDVVLGVAACRIDDICQILEIEIMQKEYDFVFSDIEADLAELEKGEPGKQ